MDTLNDEQQKNICGNTIKTGIATTQPQLSSKCESLVLQDIT